jgi:HSP20 family protein
MTDLITKTFRPDFPTIFDVLFKDILDNTTSSFNPVSNTKFHYPIDIKETPDGIVFELAIVGVDKKEISIEIENDVLKIGYENKPNDDINNPCRYLYKGITRKSFNFAWKLGGRFDTTKVEAGMDQGILSITIPYVDVVKKVVEIN